MKKLLSIMLAVTLLVSALIAAAPAFAEDEIIELVWQYPAWGNVTQGFYDVEAALNEMTERDIGIHITFEPTGLQESQNDAILKVSSGEPLDICLTAFVSVGNLVDKGIIIPLDDVLTEEDIASFKEHNANPVTGVAYNGEIYGIPCGDKIYQVLGYSMKKRFAEKYDCIPDNDKIYTMAEMEAIFDRIKEGEGDSLRTQVPWNNTYEPLNYSLCEYDKFGGDMSYGVLMLNRSFTDTTVVDLFETDEYREYCEAMYRWAQKGFISADAAVTTDAPNDIVIQDNYTGWYGWGDVDPDMLDNSWGEDIVLFKSVDGFISSTIAGVSWNVTINCEHPEAAIKAIRYVYEHPEAATLIQYGIENRDWRLVREENGLKQIEYTEEDYTKLAYINPYGLWGDRLSLPTMGARAIDTFARMKAYQDKVIADGRITPSAGYVFNPDPVSADVAAVQTVIAQYAPSLNAGAVDPEKALPDFIAALKDAGIDSIIAENQKQFDAWLETQK